MRGYLVLDQDRIVGRLWWLLRETCDSFVNTPKQEMYDFMDLLRQDQLSFHWNKDTLLWLWSCPPLQHPQAQLLPLALTKTAEALHLDANGHFIPTSTRRSFTAKRAGKIDFEVGYVPMRSSHPHPSWLKQAGFTLRASSSPNSIISRVAGLFSSFLPWRRCHGQKDKRIHALRRS